MQSFIKKSLRPSETVELADLDVTPIMNMFIILIPFLVSMAVFTHLAVLHFSLPPNAGSRLSNPNKKPLLKLTVVVAEEYLAITHGEHMLDSITLTDGGYDLQTLSKQLLLHRSKVDSSNEAVIAVRNRIAFKHVVKVMDVCRNAGFKKIGLSNGTENPQHGV